MNENAIRQTEETEIDLKKILRAVLNRAWLVVLVTLVCTAIVITATYFLVTPKYESTAMFYVNNSAFSVGDTSQSISSGDLSTSRNLVDSYIVILNTRETLNEVIAYAEVDRSYDELKDMLTAGAVNSTEIIKVTVTSHDPNEAEKIANAIAHVMPERISNIIEGTSAKVVDYAVVPSSPSSPSYVKNAILGIILGFVLSVGGIALREIFDVTIRTEENVIRTCAHPILASVPDMAVPGKGSSYYGYGSKRSKKKKSGSHTDPKQPVLIGEGISFAASEAYKLLRTKLQFSFADEEESSCRVIGLSSALSGEGKSLSSINLTYALSQLNKKVILIDCDMRRPTLAEKLRIRKKPGLSSFLTGQCGLEELIQQCGSKNGGTSFHVISAGQRPPNPVELLSSVRMEKMLAILKKVYDYVIIDLPPIGEVSDAMTVANMTDGMLLVVRQNYCETIALSEAVRQFEFVDTRILGIIFNCTSEHTGKYNKRYYKRYYHRYGKNYGYGSYEHSDRSASEKVIKA